jgi:propanol-preferring alcohol dehydrogenase
MNSSYRAVQVTRPGVLEIVERPLPAPGFKQARVRVEACGVCHTDSFTVEGLSPGLAFPRVPGHEVVGRIDALGDGVTNWKIGQRVGVAFLGGQCGVCEYCRRGDFVNCRNQSISGLTYDGGYAEVMIVNVDGLVAIPEELSSVDAAPLLCAGVTTFNALRNSPARPGDLVAVHGIGGLGHLGVQYARQMGFRVVAIARGAEKAPLAKQLGAHVYIDSQDQDPVIALQKLGGARVILATVSNSKAMSPLIDGLAPRGRLIVAGAGSDVIEVSPAQLVFGLRGIDGTLTGSAIDNEDTLAFSVLENIRAMIEVMPLAKAAEAYGRMMRNEARFRIVLTTGG